MSRSVEQGIMEAWVEEGSMGRICNCPTWFLGLLIVLLYKFGPDTAWDR